MHTSLALVHHANQYLITTGYDNREGLDAVIGKPDSGLTGVLCLHERLEIPMNLHISGTLLEAAAWHQPEFLRRLKRLIGQGLIEVVGSSYGQNIMRFFGVDYNRRQLNEELFLYLIHLGVDPTDVKVFWPPERVWETRRMAPVLCDSSLLNHGYQYVILDDRLLHPHRGADEQTRDEYDRTGQWSPDLFQMHEIEGSEGLIAFPIATRLRRGIPPRQDEDWNLVRTELEASLVYAQDASTNLLSIYADDMEKVAGIGEWGGDGLEHYRAFLEWVKANQWIQFVRLSDWAAANRPAGTRKIQLGTFEELAKDFQAGEGYEKWYFAPDWAPYRRYFEWAEERVNQLEQESADPSLIELARKQLLVGNWETAWHTPANGPHGDPDHHGHASPWARALTSHARHAAVTAEAAHWMKHKDGRAHATRIDIDDDGEDEIVLKSDRLFAVVTPRWGGRVVALFDIGGSSGAMVVGNPCDDWNWMQELNRYMDVPRNHPGAFADVGFEHDGYQARILQSAGEEARVRLSNTEPTSAIRGLIKEYSLESGASHLAVTYTLPAGIKLMETEFGLSPDYLNLLRGGSEKLETVSGHGSRGYRTGSTEVWVAGKAGCQIVWANPYQEQFGHGRMLRLGCTDRSFTILLGIGPFRSGRRSEPRDDLEMVPA